MAKKQRGLYKVTLRHKFGVMSTTVNVVATGYDAAIEKLRTGDYKAEDVINVEREAIIE